MSHSSRVLGDEGRNVEHGTIVRHQKGLFRRAVFGVPAHDCQVIINSSIWLLFLLVSLSRSRSS